MATLVRKSKIPGQIVAQLWEQRFKELEAFQRKHGHCNVPRSYPPNQSLAYWVDRMRKAKSMGRLDKESIRRLYELGFSWSLLHRRFHKRDLDELVALVAAFKKRHGHCDFTVAREGDRDFKWWVMDVRKSKKQGRLDAAHCRQLDRLGFLWEPRKQAWGNMCSVLRQYRRRYGDCCVPPHWPENPKLALWVSRMRAAKRRNLLTKTEIQELNRLHFEWQGDRPHSFDTRFAELVVFEKRYGHCRVPWTYPRSPKLGPWVSNVRQRKKSGRISRENIRCLNALGFTWATKKASKRRRKS